MRIKYIFLVVEIGIIHLPQNHVGIFLFLPFLFNDCFRSRNVIMEPTVNISQQIPKTPSQFFQLIVHLLVPVKGTICAANQDQVVSQAENWSQFLFLELSQVPVNFEVFEMFGVFFDFADNVFVGSGVVRVEEFAGNDVVHEDFFTELAHFVDFAFELSVLGNESFVDKIKFGLEGNFNIFQNMLDFGFEDSKVILYFTFFFFDLILKVVNIFLLILEQEDQILRKDIALIIVQERQLRG